jgi:serine/threonine protein kinase
MRKGQRLTDDEQLRVFYQLVSGYKVLYDRKILHQDLKPDNILLKSGTYKIADFGLSVFYEGHTYDDRRQGTVSYIAPEKLTVREYRGHPKSDVYSMGVIMFELMMGRHPYAEYRGDLKQYVQDFKDAQLRLPSNYTNQYSLRMLPLIEIVMKMVAKNEVARIGFDEIWEFVSRHELFE